MADTVDTAERREVVGSGAAASAASGTNAFSARPEISWAAIIAGAIAALATWLLLYTFGLAVGLSSIDPGDSGSLKSSGIFTGIWGLVSPLLALFLGGFVAGRMAGVPARSEGATHGFIVWGLTTLLGAMFVVMALSALIGGVASVGRAAIGAGGAAVQRGVAAGPGLREAANWFGLDAEDAIRPVNDRLRAEGKPTITSDQVVNASRDVVGTAVREGRFDREMLIGALSQNTALARGDAEEIAARVETQFQNARSSVGASLQDAARSAGTAAMEAADASGRVFWGVFGALLLGLISSVAGGALGIRRASDRRQPQRAAPFVRVNPAAPPREAYP